MINIAVCDDEPAILEMMKQYLNGFSQKYELEFQITTLTDGDCFFECAEQFDIIFLDIGIDNKNGIEIGSRIRETDKKVKIIYVTAFRDYMKDAFGIHAFDYLVKPVTEKKIYSVLLEVFSYDNLNEDRIVSFRTKTGVVSIKAEDILYFEYCNRNVLLYDDKNHVLELPGEKISAIAERMKPYHFEVSHKSFVVNLYQIESIKNYTIFMKYGKVVPLSQMYSKRFRKKMHDYLNSRI